MKLSKKIGLSAVILIIALLFSFLLLSTTIFKDSDFVRRYPVFNLKNINKVKANKSFLGCSGFDVKAGMSTAILQEVSINEIMISRCAGEVFILADATKINYVHQFIVADPSNFNYLITDTRCTDEQIDQFTEKGIKTKRLSPIYIYK